MNPHYCRAILWRRKSGCGGRDEKWSDPKEIKNLRVVSNWRTDGAAVRGTADIKDKLEHNIPL